MGEWQWSSAAAEERVPAKFEEDGNSLDSERKNDRAGEKAAEGKLRRRSVSSALLSNLDAKKSGKGGRSGGVLHLYSKGVATPSLSLLSPLSLCMYINGPSRSRCRPIKYIHFAGFYSAAHLLSVYEWRPLNSIQFTFKAGFIGTTEAEQAYCGPPLPHRHVPHTLLRGKKPLFVNTNKLFRRSVSHVAGLGDRCVSNV